MASTGFSFTKIVVRNVDAAERFYCDVMGMKLAFRFQTGEGEFELEEAILSSTGAMDGGHGLVVIRYLNQPAPTPGEGIFGFTVKDVDATIAATLAVGGTLYRPARVIEEHGIKVAFVKDPEGHLLELVEMLPKAA